jgi:hypothetical protein
VGQPSSSVLRLLPLCAAASSSLLIASPVLCMRFDAVFATSTSTGCIAWLSNFVQPFLVIGCLPEQLWLLLLVLLLVLLGLPVLLLLLLLLLVGRRPLLLLPSPLQRLMALLLPLLWFLPVVTSSLPEGLCRACKGRFRPILLCRPARISLPCRLLMLACR